MAFFGKKNEDLEIAQRLLRISELQGILDILQKKKGRDLEMTEEMLRITLGMIACNLAQTMKADFIARKFSQKRRDAILEEYILESYRTQTLVKFKGEAGMNERRLAVMDIVAEFQKLWKEEEDPQGSGPGPRYFCAKEALHWFGAEADYGLHDALYEHMYLKHKLYLDFFNAL